MKKAPPGDFAAFCVVFSGAIRIAELRRPLCGLFRNSLGLGPRGLFRYGKTAKTCTAGGARSRGNFRPLFLKAAGRGAEFHGLEKYIFVQTYRKD